MGYILRITAVVLVNKKREKVHYEYNVQGDDLQSAIAQQNYHFFNQKWVKYRQVVDITIKATEK